MGQAARLVGVPSQTLRRWVVGSPEGKSALPTPASLIGGEATLDFADLVSALFIRSFREHGVSLQHIRVAALRAAKDLDHERPFSLRNFTTDGRRIFRWFDDTKGVLHDAGSGQQVIVPIFKPLLKKIRYGLGNQADRWYPLGEGKAVVIDPALSLGEPTVRGIPTRVLYGPVQGGASAAEVAQWYGLKKAEVLAACQFERQMHAQAA